MKGVGGLVDEESVWGRKTMSGDREEDDGKGNIPKMPLPCTFTYT